MKSLDNVWRKPTAEEKARFKKAATNTLKLVGRPALPESKKAVGIYIKLEPDLIKKFKDKSKKTGKPYQTLIKEALKKAS
jgi:uncharacterized protein (DUF4415 family)